MKLVKRICVYGKFVSYFTDNIRKSTLKRMFSIMATFFHTTAVSYKNCMRNYILEGTV